VQNLGGYFIKITPSANELQPNYWLTKMQAFAEQNPEINSDFVLPPTDRNNPTDKHNNQ
jgi:hypothetical protein